MAAVLDLDLNCSPPSPDPAAHDDLNRSTLRQHHTFRDQVKDLRRLYWTRNNLRVTDAMPSWNHSSDALLYAHHPYDMVDLNNTQDPDGFSHCHELGRQEPHFFVNGVSWGHLDVNSLTPRKHDSGSVQQKSGCHYVIDLEKPVTLDAEIVSSPAFTNYANHNGGLLTVGSYGELFGDACSLKQRSEQPLCYFCDTPDSHSPARIKNKTSGRMFIDLNVAQEDDLNFCPDPSKLVCSTSTSSAARQSGDVCNNSNKTFLKGSESSIGSSKGSSITVARPCYIEASNPLPRKNIHHQMISGLDSQGCMELEVPQKVFSVCSSGRNNSYSGLGKLGDSQSTNLMLQAAVVLHRDPQEETITVISDDEAEGIDLNVAADSTDFPGNFESNYLRTHVNNDERNCLAQNEDQQNIASIECPKSRDDEDVESPVSGSAIIRSVLIPETPQGRDYACPRLRSSSNNGASAAPEAIRFPERKVGGDESSAATAAETLISMFASKSARFTDGLGSNSGTDSEDASQESAPSLNSFEESILSLEEMKDDGESVPVRASGKDGPSCGIKLKRGRGLRDFQREILPGLVSLARHEICDDLRLVGYEVRKTRSRRGPGEVSPPT